MIPDSLYDLAFQFRTTKLWDELCDSELFAVRHADGTIGYCCVMGMLGEHLALAVYPGDAGMDSYRAMGKDRSDMDFLGMQEDMLSQDCVMVSFENKSELNKKEAKEVRAYCAAHGLKLSGKNAFPQFRRYRPRYVPWHLNEPGDQARLAEALEASIEVAQKLHPTIPEALGFADGAPYDRTIPLLEKKDGAFIWSEIALPQPLPVCHPSPEIRDEFALAKLAKAGKKGGEWACDIFMHVEPFVDGAEDDEWEDEPKSAPFYPYIMMIVDNKTGMVDGVELCNGPESYEDDFTKAVLDMTLRHGKPTRILVCNERAYAFFSKLAVQMGTKLVKKQHIPLLEEAKQSFVERFAGENGEPGDEIEEMMAMLRDPEVLAAMPDAVLMQLAEIAVKDGLPSDIEEHVRRECKKRGLK